MSRSFKKTPGFTSSGSSHRRVAKKQANVKVRNTPDIPNGKAYKKIFCSWDIDDYPYILFSKGMYNRYVEDIWRRFRGEIWDHEYSWNRIRNKTEQDVMSRCLKPKCK